MDDIVVELNTIAAECEQVAKQIKSEPLQNVVSRLTDSINDVARSSSNSWLGYQAYVYYKDFRPPAPGDHFDSEWGLTDSFTKHVSDNWREVPFETIYDYVIKKAGSPDTDGLSKAAEDAGGLFDEKKEHLLTVLTILRDQTKSSTIEEMRNEAKNTRTYTKEDIIRAISPSGLFRSRDSLAMSQGIETPHHLEIMAWVQAAASPFNGLADLSKIARRTAAIVSRSAKGAAITEQRPSSQHRVFVGHGRSPLWKDLKEFLEDRLRLHVEEFI